LLTGVYKIPKEQLYVTVFGGDEKENLPKDEEAYNFWKEHIAKDRILLGNKKDNFWEMGDTGPCGPCSEIHVDCRSEAERKETDGSSLVNADHPQVIEIWNNVFMQFNRLKDGTLQPLPAKHVDTGMGLERLVRVLQGKQSNYDTDLFSGTIREIEKIAGKTYEGTDSKRDIAFRVLADHIRAIGFTIADGQLPSNTGAGYVIRRILRRAVRYYYSYLDYKQPLLFQLMPVLAKQFEHVFPELEKQIDLVSKVVKEEEEAFLRTLDKGLIRFRRITHDALMEAIGSSIKASGIEVDYNVQFYLGNQNFYFDIYLPQKRIAIEIKANASKNSNMATDFSLGKVIVLDSKDISLYSPQKIKSIIVEEVGINVNEDPRLYINGREAFELYDTYGFPIDLTRLIGSEYNLQLDEAAFEKEMLQQKARSRAATALDTDDWVVLKEGTNRFIGYNHLEAEASIMKYRRIKTKGKEAYQLVLDVTPFYAESGGQVGDTGELIFPDESIQITDTKKENDLIIHFSEVLPSDPGAPVLAKVDAVKRIHTAVHHSATHLLHAALRTVLGPHVAQKGSLVNEEHLRFDFSHFSKVSDEEMAQIEALVNEKIREDVPVVIREMSKEEAIEMGAMALFGEKYGDRVRVVIMDPEYSIELCGGTHVGATGQLGFFKIKQEGAVAAGVRRIEAVSGKAAEEYVNEEIETLDTIKNALKNTKDPLKAIEKLQEEKTQLEKHVEMLEARQLVAIRNEILTKDEIINGVTFVGDVVEVSSPDALKKLCSDVKHHLNDHVIVLAANIGGKPFIAVGVDEKVVAAKGLDANKIIKEHIAPLIKGGGGGQKTLATAGGQNVENLEKAIEVVKGLL
jgi:alanyl-tRNA synthetase